MIKKSLWIGNITALYFLPEIYNHFHGNFFTFGVAFLLQAFHDAICIYFFLLCISCIRTNNQSYILCLNILHTMIMGLFCFYKRCVLTLWYNQILNIDMCKRYIPIWQRSINFIYTSFMSLSSSNSCKNLDGSDQQEWQLTYLWLNNHIIQTSLVGMVNIYKLIQVNKNIYIIG